MTDEEFAELEARYKAEMAARRKEKRLRRQREYMRVYLARPERKAKYHQYYLANREKIGARNKARHARMKAARQASKQ